jgi:hypothetical protein
VRDHARVDYDRTGHLLDTLIVRAAPIPERGAFAGVAADGRGVVEVTGVMTGEANGLVQAVGTDGDDVSRIAEGLGELGLRVSDEDPIRDVHHRPSARFGNADEP